MAMESLAFFPSLTGRHSLRLKSINSKRDKLIKEEEKRRSCSLFIRINTASHCCSDSDRENDMAGQREACCWLTVTTNEAWQLGRATDTLDTPALWHCEFPYEVNVAGQEGSR